MTIDFLVGACVGASLATTIPAALQSTRRAATAIRRAREVLAEGEAADQKPRLYVLPRHDEDGAA